MTDLRERVIKAVASANVVLYLGEWERIADAVIAELNLDKDFGCPVAGHYSCRCSHRYTTPWKDNDD
jgi:hypothetical protein